MARGFPLHQARQPSAAPLEAVLAGDVVSPSVRPELFRGCFQDLSLSLCLSLSVSLSPWLCVSPSVSRSLCLRVRPCADHRGHALSQAPLRKRPLR